MKGEYIYRKSRGIWAGIVDLCLTEYVPLNGGRQTGGGGWWRLADGEEGGSAGWSGYACWSSGLTLRGRHDS